MKDIVVSMKGIRKSYGNYVVVHDFSLDMIHGEIVCLLGPSGCGKTTTLRIVAGFIEPTGGRIIVNGKDVTDSPPYRRNTGMVFQAYALFPHMTVAQNVAFGLECRKMAAAARRQRVDEMLALIEMSHLRDRLPKQLSGGQQQRVALARAIAPEPAVLLLDEPFSNLDAQLRVRLREELRALIKRVNITTLFVTHDQEEALAIADRVVVMDRGVVEQIGRPTEIYEHPRTEFVASFLGTCSSLSGQLDGKGRLQLRDNISLPCDGPAGDVRAIIRPEFVRPATVGETAPVFGARVLSSSYLGHISRVVVDLAGEKVVMDARFPGGLPPRAGETLDVVIDPEGVRLIRTANIHSHADPN
ncbi:ABC transporter ATP-binding protein [Bradyrhizobium sp. RT11b]|uniref:ABC transporter ATP-binding protein n=1 Tax=Bradyrhizobium sp. RT11b TaxID=3156332 RepID=UPI0033968765